MTINHTLLELYKKYENIIFRDTLPICIEWY